MSSFTHAGRTFGLTLVKDGNKLSRVVINDGGLEFPFASGGYDKAADFLVEEYGGTKEEVLKLLESTESLVGLEIAGAPAAAAPSKGKTSKKAAKGKKGEDAAGADAKPEKPEKPEKPPKPEPVIKSFTLADGQTTEKKLQMKTVLPDQKPERVEDVKLDEKYAIHIDIYSKKNRTTFLYVIKDGTDVASYPASVETEILGGVSLMDVIYAYAAEVGMSFAQADKYIKIKRGLLPEPEPKKAKEPKTKKGEDATATTTAADNGGAAPAEANTAEANTAGADMNTSAEATQAAE